MNYLFASAVMLLPAVVSMILDYVFLRPKSRKRRELKKFNANFKRNIISKYLFYVLFCNFTASAAVSITRASTSTILEVLAVKKMGKLFALFTFCAAVCLPFILRKRLPVVIQNVVDKILSCRVLFCSVSVVALAIPVVIDLSAERGEVTMYNLFGYSLLSLVAGLLSCSIFGIVKDIKSVGSKKFKDTVSKRFSEEDNIEFKKRFGFATLINAAFVFSVIVFIPYETYLSNISEFVFEFSCIAWLVIVEAFIYMFFLSFGMLLLKGKALDIAVSVCFGFTLASYIQGMFLNGNMTVLNGGNAQYNTATAVWNVIIWVAIVLIPVILTIFKVKFKNYVLGLGCLLIVGMQSVAFVSMLITVEQPKVDTRLTEVGLFDVAEDNNVIVFVLDCFDQDNVDKMLEADPNSLDGLKGFTCYDNVTGSYCYTHLSIPYLLTGERIAQFNPSNEQFSASFENSDYFNSIVDKVSNVGVYTEDTRVTSDYARERINNVRPGKNSLLNISSVIVSSQKASMYRSLPLCFKKYFNYTANDFNWAVESTRDGLDYYASSPPNDAATYRELVGYGLKINESYTDGCYRFIHTSGAHEPWTLSRDCTFHSISYDAVESSLGSIKLVTKYLERLNELGVYENSTIIITSDHGTCKSYHMDEEIDISINPIMFYKPKGVAYEEPMKRSDVPVSHDDVFPTVMNALGLEYTSETGMILDEITEETERTRYYYWCRREPDMPDSGWSFLHMEYAITGDSRDSENWHFTGRIDHCNGWTGEK